MSDITRSSFMRLIAVAAGTVLASSTAIAEQDPKEQHYNATVNNADKSKHTSQGGTQPGPGTHGHSSANSPSRPGETQRLQQQQHGMQATPPHSSQSLTKP